jgi:hypothetical protein
MSYPVRSEAKVTWFSPANDKKPITYGQCADRYFQDVRLLNEARDPMVAPTPSEMFWRATTNTSLYVLPNVRGALFNAIKETEEPDDGIVPVEGLWQPIGWYDKNNNPSSPWIKKMHELFRYKVALYSPSTPPDFLGRGKIKCASTLSKGGGCSVGFKMFTPYVSENTKIRPYYGIRICFGIDINGWRYALNIPAEKCAVPNSDHWWLEDRDGLILDRISSPSGEEKGSESKADWITIQNCAGMMVISSNLLGKDNEWVYAPVDNPNKDNDFYDFNISGEWSVEIWGCRGWISPGKLEYATETTLTSPKMYYPDWVTRASEYKINYTSLPNTTVSMVAEEVAGTITSTITHTNNETTPVLISLQEIHRTVLQDLPEQEDGIDITEYIKSISVNKGEDGKGHTASLTLRNWEIIDGVHTFGVLDDQLLGIGKVKIELKHNIDEAFSHIFTGYATDMNNTRSGDSLYPELSISLTDATFFLQDNRSTGLGLPSFAGWNFIEAIELIFEHWGWDIDDILDLTDISADLKIPNQLLSDNLKFEADTDLYDIIDKICYMSNVHWTIEGDGTFNFTNYPLTYASSVFTIQEDNADDKDMIFNVDTSRNYNDIRTVFYGLGVDKYGFTREHLYYNGRCFDTDSDSYVGRSLYSITKEEDNSNINNTILRKLAEQSKIIRTVSWNTIGKNLQPGDKVTFDVDHCGLASGTELIIKSVSIDIDTSDIPIWKESYTCGLIK